MTQDSLISAQENRAMFDRIAGWYDRTNRVLSLGLDKYWRSRAISALAPQAGGTYLDVGCGTADVAIEVARKEPAARVVGVDRSAGMLERGREKVEAAGLSDRISLLDGDALALQFRDESIEGVITAFCIRNVTDREGALREFYRVLVPGGRLVILELTDPANPVMRPLFRIYSEIVMPLVTRLMSSERAYRYLTASMAAFPPAEEFRVKMESAGFKENAHQRLTGGITTLFLGRK